MHVFHSSGEQEAVRGLHLARQNFQTGFWRHTGVAMNHITAVFLWTLKLYTGRFIKFAVITNIYNKKTKGPTLMELFTATGKLKKFFFDN